MDIDEFSDEVAKRIHHYFNIDAISIVLRSHRKNKLNIYSPTTLMSIIGARTGRSRRSRHAHGARLKSKEMLLIASANATRLPLRTHAVHVHGAIGIQTLCPAAVDVRQDDAWRVNGPNCEASLHRQPQAAASTDCRTCGICRGQCAGLSGIHRLKERFGRRRLWRSRSSLITSTASLADKWTLRRRWPQRVNEVEMVAQATVPY